MEAPLKFVMILDNIVMLKDKSLWKLEKPGISSVTPKLCPVRVNPNTISSGLMKPPGHGRIQISSITSQHASRTSNDEQKATVNSVKEGSCKVAFSTVKESGFKDQKTTSTKPAEEVEACNANVIVKPVKKCYNNVIAKEAIACNINAEEAKNKSLGTSSTSANAPPIIGIDSCPVAEPEKSGVEVRESTIIRTKLSLYRHCFPALCTTWKGGFTFFDTTTPGKFYGGFNAQPPCRVNRKAYEFSRTMPTILGVNLLPLNHIRSDIFQNDYPDFRDIALYFLPSPTIERSKGNYDSLFKLLEIENSVMRSYISGMELLIFTSKQLHSDLQDVTEMLNTGQFLWGVFRNGQDKIALEQDYASIESSETVDMEIDMVGGRPLGRVDADVNVSNSKILNAFKSEANIPPGFEELSRQKLRNMQCKAKFREEETHFNDGEVVRRAKKGNIDLHRYPQSSPMELKIEVQNFECDKQDHSHKLSARSLGKTQRPACWIPPRTGSVKLNIAESSKTKTEAAGASGVIRDESGKWVIGYTLNLGSYSCLGAELWAVYHGLMLAWDRGFKKVLVESQSLESLEYLKRVPDELDPNRALATCCMNLIKRDWDCQFLHIHREANGCANWLATNFQDHPLGLTVFYKPPVSLIPILQNDSMMAAPSSTHFQS
ncbi:uncharacterized protein LOC105640619 isoform X2 [Jatropha curcas]|uniref:uncharacterized protein LOC105640619 isoform X2 n=1 Tax=Jatropha curcas TaxID=180498 RepID=UPI0009D73546|nr:uncharacterized protein LOC105640619 isoform X2 [Jatropha curcas]